jgi:hypothetical protein
MTTASDYLGSAWCADADGSGGFTNWRQASDPSTCTNATTGTGTWYFLPLADAQGLVSFAAGLPAPTPQFTSDEVTALKLQAANPSPFNLSPSDGGLISGAVALVWITGWAFKKFVQALNTDGAKE